MNETDAEQVVRIGRFVRAGDGMKQSWPLLRIHAALAIPPILSGGALYGFGLLTANGILAIAGVLVFAVGWFAALLILLGVFFGRSYFK